MDSLTRHLSLKVIDTNKPLSKKFYWEHTSTRPWSLNKGFLSVVLRHVLYRTVQFSENSIKIETVEPLPSVKRRVPKTKKTLYFTWNVRDFQRKIASNIQQVWTKQGRFTFPEEGRKVKRLSWPDPMVALSRSTDGWVATPRGTGEQEVVYLFIVNKEWHLWRSWSLRFDLVPDPSRRRRKMWPNLPNVCIVPRQCRSGKGV